MSVNSIFRNERGKVTTAVFLVEVDREIPDEIIELCTPGFLQKTGVPFNIHRGSNCTRWCALKANRQQVTGADYTKKVSSVLGIPRDAVRVELLAGLGQVGERDHEGTSRAETRRQFANVPVGIGIAAR